MESADNLIHALGRSPSGRSTIYVVEPHGNVVFADATLPIDPSALVLDVQPADPAHDRQQAIALGPDGSAAVVDVGSNAFAAGSPASLPGDHRCPVPPYANPVSTSRGGSLPDPGVDVGRPALPAIADRDERRLRGGLHVAAITLLAALIQSRSARRRLAIEILVGLPAVGLLLGLALGSKWVGAYAIGGAVLLVLLRSWSGRRLALAGMVAITGVLGYLAIARDPANVSFLVLMLTLTVILAVGIAIGERDGRGTWIAARWTAPRWKVGLPFVWALASLTLIPVAVYIASFIPSALTAGEPQLVSGWPPGHGGETLLGLQAAMYRYHDEFRFPHGQARRGGLGL